MGRCNQGNGCKGGACGVGHAGLGLRAGADALGAVLVTAGLMLAVYTIVGATSHGWLSGAIALVLLGAFFVRQATAAAPLLPLRLRGASRHWR